MLLLEQKARALLVEDPSWCILTPGNEGGVGGDRKLLNLPEYNASLFHSSDQETL